MKKIKILKLEFVGNCYQDDYVSEIVRSITEWNDISDEEYDYLINTNEGHKYLKKNNLIVVSMPDNQQELISNTVKGIVYAIEQEENRMRALQKKQKEEEAKAAEKKRLKAIEKAKKLLKESGEL